jgi:hypothetical protein
VPQYTVTEGLLPPFAVILPWSTAVVDPVTVAAESVIVAVPTGGTYRQSMMYELVEVSAISKKILKVFPDAFLTASKSYALEKPPFAVSSATTIGLADHVPRA